MLRFLTQSMTEDSIRKQFFHSFDGEGYYLFYVSDSCFDRQSGQEDKDTHLDISPWFGSNRYNHFTAPRKHGQLKAIFSRWEAKETTKLPASEASIPNERISKVAQKVMNINSAAILFTS